MPRLPNGVIQQFYKIVGVARPSKSPQFQHPTTEEQP